MDAVLSGANGECDRARVEEGDCPAFDLEADNGCGAVGVGGVVAVNVKDYAVAKCDNTTSHGRAANVGAGVEESGVSRVGAIYGYVGSGLVEGLVACVGINIVLGRSVRAVSGLFKPLD